MVWLVEAETRYGRGEIQTRRVKLPSEIYGRGIYLTGCFSFETIDGSVKSDQIRINNILYGRESLLKARRVGLEIPVYGVRIDFVKQKNSFCVNFFSNVQKVIEAIFGEKSKTVTDMRHIFNSMSPHNVPMFALISVKESGGAKGAGCLLVALCFFFCGAL